MLAEEVSSSGDGLFRSSPVVNSVSSNERKLTTPPWRQTNEEKSNEEKVIDENQTIDLVDLNSTPTDKQQETNLNEQLTSETENQPEDMGENLYNIKSNLRNEESSKKSILYKVRKWLANIINPDLPSSG